MEKCRKLEEFKEAELKTEKMSESNQILVDGGKIEV